MDILKKILPGIIIISVAITAMIIYNTISSNEIELGTFTLIVQDENSNEILSDEIEIDKEVTLLEVLIQDYTVTCASSTYTDTECDASNSSSILLSIEGVQSTWTTSFLQITINGGYGTTGIAGTYPSNNDIIIIKKVII